MPERKTLNEDLFYRGSSANLPRLHTCEIKPRSGIKVNLSRHTIVIGAFGTVTKGLLKGTGGLGSWQTSGDHQNYSIIENSQNTEKHQRDLLSLKLQ